MIRTTSRFALILTAFTFPVLGMDFSWGSTPATPSTRVGYFLQMTGDINAGDYEKFRAFVRKNLDRYKSHRSIHLSSNGGNLLEALKIAGLLRSMYPTIRVESGKCASSCFYLYLSGITRFAASSSLGIHRAYFEPKYFAGLKLEEARKKQTELTKALDSILDENGVPQYLKETMFKTSSKDIYWLNDEDVSALGVRPAWYEELMIAKCNYGEFLKVRKELHRRLESGEEIDDSLYDKGADSYLVYLACEKKTIDAELTILSASLGKGPH